jgi:paraquat-inducible protein B
MQFSAFIGSDYARLVDEETLFYSAGGLDLKVGGGGVQLGGGTLESILSPSITFTEPTEGHLRSTPLPDGHTFVLYANFEEAHRPQFNPTLTYLLLFSGSVRGLSSDAPVEFRGIRVGTVVGASFKYFPDDPEHRIPVLIKIDPTLLLDQPASNPADAQELIAQNVGKGLRASLKSSSLLTGQLYVDLDFQKNPSPAMMANVGNYEVLPTAPAPGLDELQGKFGTLIDKLTALEVEKTVKNLNDALGGVKGAAANLDKLTASDGSLNKTLKNAEKLTDELSGNKDIGGTLHNLKETSVRLNQTISELSAQFKTVGQNLTEATDTLKRQPWRLVWPSTKKYDENSQVTTPRARPTPSRRTSQSRR